MSIVYGPVPSWRLGRSLGIDLVSTAFKTCTFDCVYCQLGKTANKREKRRYFVSLERLKRELESVKDVPADYATFSGVGEPTLAKNIGKAIELARQVLRMPVAVLTNSSLMADHYVCHELARADVVVAKLDAPDDHLLQEINRPVFNRSFHSIFNGIKSFRAMFTGKLALQMMFIEANKNRAAELAEIAEQLSPDEVQLNTPLRPCPVSPLRPEEMLLIEGIFTRFEHVVSVYHASKPVVVPVDSQQTVRRRPEVPKS